MKKVFFAAVAVLALASCTKDWTCECKNAEGQSWVAQQFKDTKKDVAESGCNSWDNAAKVSGGSCSIK